MSEMGMAMMGTGSAEGENRAQIAAAEAVSSPLLEDINISGARGILVNVTAGADLNIMELDEVGMTVKEFASEDATVVIGTVIDAEMSGHLRVTVVATGLNDGLAVGAKPDVKSMMREIKLPERPDFEELDKPMVARRHQRAVGGYIVPALPNEDLLDIPAFLRKQAD